LKAFFSYGQRCLQQNKEVKEKACIIKMRVLYEHFCKLYAYHQSRKRDIYLTERLMLNKKFVTLRKWVDAFNILHKVNSLAFSDFKERQFVKERVRSLFFNWRRISTMIKKQKIL
jgi:hypothetical protein